MRQVLSAALVALIVGSFAGATMGALAQSQDQPSVTQDAFGPAGLNADTVDGKHAVSATGKASKRARKLVATNNAGLLPSNIVKPIWGNIKNVPDGFADGVDDGITHLAFTQVVSVNQSIAAGGNNSVTATCPAGSKAISGGFGASSFLVASVESFQSGNGWIAVAHNFDSSAHTIFATAVCMTTEPAGAASLARVGRKPALLVE